MTRLDSKWYWLALICALFSGVSVHFDIYSVAVWLGLLSIACSMQSTRGIELSLERLK